MMAYKQRPKNEKRNREIRLFRTRLLKWYAQHRFDLPWRHTRDPYKILVSEIMLQQTQVDRVKRKWPEFLRQFPNLKSLSQSPISTVIHAWKGMGYNRRALYLQRTAQAVVKSYRGRFPQTLSELQSLPGVGEYSSRALMVFAFGKPFIAPDVNVLRILRRSFGRNMTVNELIEIGDKIVTPKNAYDINQALMDLGRTVCTAKNPKNALCPLHTDCIAHDPEVPKKTKRSEPMFTGVPRRIWRGRIVELVRAQKRIPTNQLMIRLGIETDPESEQWLLAVLGVLSKEGLIEIKKRSVTLP